MSEGWNIAILGATGAVGEALLETLAERQFPVGEIYALARTDSAGEQLRFGGKSLMVQDAAAFDWTQAQLAFFAAGAQATASYIEEATNSGCLVIDLSGTAKPLIDLFSPEAAKSDVPPIEIDSLDVNKIKLTVAGAEVPPGPLAT